MVHYNQQLLLGPPSLRIDQWDDSFCLIKAYFYIAKSHFSGRAAIEWSEEQTVVEWLSTVCNKKKEEQGMLCKVLAVCLL